ncbi:MAG: hypothetical protein AMJ88_06620 [Anaerolineae bacterium SM23_ 63]|nr:MAG: hypothetical protein AMJ88_06620 [Anaerolineae bacterium SM23_ 63]HEY46374.1 hypothetical protein [Anaerolineae bacterium]
MAGENSIESEWLPSPWKRRLGFAIRVAGAVGIIFGLLGIILVPFISDRANTFAKSMLTTTTRGVRSIAETIREVDSTLGDAVVVLDSASVTLTSVAGSIEDSKPLIRSTGELLGDRIPRIIIKTHRALISAEEGARAIDQVLRSLATLGPITGITYTPEKPLDKAISDVAISLEPLPGELIIVREDLAAATSDLDETTKALEKASESLDIFADGLDGMEVKLTSLGDDLDAVADKLTQTEAQIPSLILGALVTVEMILLWFALCQCAIFIVGSHLLRSGNLTQLPLVT